MGCHLLQTGRHGGSCKGWEGTRLCSLRATRGPCGLSPIAPGSQLLGPETVESGTFTLHLNPLSSLSNQSLPSLCSHATANPSPLSGMFCPVPV